MSAWGEGMQANDTALDAIGGHGRQLKRIVRDRDPARAAIVLDEIHTNLDCEHSAWGLLGAAEHLLDSAGPEVLAQYRPAIEQALDTELAPTQLECWSDPEERRKALELFRRRLNGESVPEREVEQSNEGLLSRMLRSMEGVSYEEAYGPDEGQQTD